MKKITLHPIRAVDHQIRRGTVQIELAMFLPTYAAIIMVLVTIFSFARTRSEVAVEAQHEAWMKRETPGSETEVLSVSTSEGEEVGRILNHEQDPTLGLVSASHQKNATVYLKTLNLLTDIQLEHAVLTDTWDYSTIPFEDQKEHHRLQPGKRILAFGAIDRGVFGNLATATAGISEQASGLQKSLNQDRDEAKDVMNQARKAVTREISAKRKLINDLDSRVQDLTNIIPPDEVSIQKLQNRISDEKRELEKLNLQLTRLNSADKLLGSDLLGAAAAAE